MKKIVILLFVALCSSSLLMAQSYDDLYFTPKKGEPQKAESKKVRSGNYSSVSSGVPVVVKDRKGNVRNVDEYNRRYDSSDNSFELKDDTLYVKEKEEKERGRWTNGFNGSKDDYEYAQRLIRFRNPRFAVSISSPFYWDIVYGSNSWDWNVYTDDYYAYAFPTSTNRLWWDWRFSSHGSIGWGWNNPYYGGFYGNYYGGSWGSYYGGYYGGYNGWNSPYYSWGQGNWSSRGGYYNNRRSDFGNSSSRSSSSNRSSMYNDRRSNFGGERSSNSRVVGTRVDEFSGRRSSYGRSGSDVTTRPVGGAWMDTGSRRSSYTRPSSTRTYTTDGDANRRGSTYQYNNTYNRGGSNSNYTPSNSRSSSYDGGSRSGNYTPSNSSYNRSSEGSSRSSSSSSSSAGGGSTRSGGSRR